MGEGVDTVRSSISYALTADVENLTLTGSTTIDGTGNDLANTITGNNAGNILDGGRGADRLIGGLGDDVFIVDDAGDVVVESSSNGGVDSIYASVGYTAARNVENLSLTGTAIAATGNASANRLTGNAKDNLLDGAAGADTLIGGQGDDIYVVDNAGDAVVETAGEGVDTVRTSLNNYALADNVENLVLTGAANLKGVGNAANNVLTGNAGANTLDGAGGADTLIGGLGRRRLCRRRRCRCGDRECERGRRPHAQLRQLRAGCECRESDPYRNGSDRRNRQRPRQHPHRQRCRQYPRRRRRRGQAGRRPWRRRLHRRQRRRHDTRKQRRRDRHRFVVGRIRAFDQCGKPDSDRRGEH